MPVLVTAVQVRVEPFELIGTLEIVLLGGGKAKGQAQQRKQAEFHHFLSLVDRADQPPLVSSFCFFRLKIKKERTVVENLFDQTRSLSKKS